MGIAAADPVIHEFTEAVRDRLGRHVRSIILFGSRVRDTAWEGSDYDIAILVDHRSQEAEDCVLDAAIHVLDRYDAVVSAHVFSGEEWAVEQLTPLGLNIGKEGMHI